MRWLAERIMARRAQSLIARIRSHLPKTGMIADIGSGTGHNANELRRYTSLTVCEFDVTDLHWVGPGPTMIHANHVPADDSAFDGLLMMFILQYPESPQQLLLEASRVSRGPLILVQSTYVGWWGRMVLIVREFIWGRLAFRVACIFGIVSNTKNSLQPSHYFTRQDLVRLFESVGLKIIKSEPSEWLGLNISRDLYVLEASRP